MVLRGDLALPRGNFLSLLSIRPSSNFFIVILGIRPLPRNVSLFFEISYSNDDEELLCVFFCCCRLFHCQTLFLVTRSANKS